MKKLAIIGGGYMASIFAKKAYKMGIESHCFSPLNGVKNRGDFDYIHNIDIFLKEEICDICKTVGINGVVATTELTIPIAAYVANELGNVGISVDVASEITDKYRNRMITDNVSGLYQPRYAVVESIEDIIALNFKLPIILKPTSKGGKRGVTVINSIEDIQNAILYAKKESGSEGKLIVEEFIDGGMECSVESLSYNGKNYIIQITEKITSGAPHCVELAHHQPANLSLDKKVKVYDILDKALTVVGISNGACHTEIKIKDNKIYLIEFNARPGGDHIAYPLTYLSTGYDYIKGAIDIALDQFHGVDYSSFKNKFASIYFVTKFTPGLINVFKECEEKPWCYKKNMVTAELQDIVHNDGFNMNYFIYYSNKKPSFNI